MKVFVFDLLPYGEHLDHLKVGRELPWPLPKHHFKPDVAVRTYAEHLAAWEEMDRLGFDGVGLQRAPHVALRPDELAEPPRRLGGPAHQAAQAPRCTATSCRSTSRCASPRSSRCSTACRAGASSPASPAASRASTRSTGCRSASRARASRRRGRSSAARGRRRCSPTGQVLVLRGRGDLAAPRAAAASRRCGCRCRAARRPSSGRAATTSRSRRALVPTRGLREDIIRYYARCLASHGHRITPDHLIIQASAYVADTKAQAVKEAGPYTLYFNQTLFSHGNITESSLQRDAGYLSVGLVRLRASGEPPRRLRRPRALPRHDHGRRGARRGALALGRARRGGRADHRRRRARGRQHRPRQPQPRRDAAGDVHGAGPALRRRGPAGDSRPTA